MELRSILGKVLNFDAEDNPILFVPKAREEDAVKFRNERVRFTDLIEGIMRGKQIVGRKRL